MKDIRDMKIGESFYLKETVAVISKRTGRPCEYDEERIDINDLIIEELEKVKAEIIGSCNNIAQEVSDLSYTRKIYVYEQLTEIKGAIDKHISELKGENK